VDSVLVSTYYVVHKLVDIVLEEGRGQWHHDSRLYIAGSCDRLRKKKYILSFLSLLHPPKEIYTVYARNCA
jgi:hypothetical protein